MYPLVFLLCLITSCLDPAANKQQHQHHRPSAATVSIEKLRQHADSLRVFARTQKASTELGILVDMSVPSWKKRIFIVNLENDSVLLSGLCAQGQGKDLQREDVLFSNMPGSYCTSEGRYRLGGKYTGEYGEAYKLYGLDSTNCNAFGRTIVFHYYPSVIDAEDSTVCRSNGCPMVSPKFFSESAKFIDASNKPVLMWIYK
jgi:hypothetical protein